MAMSKEQKQKLILGVLFAGAVIYAYFEFGLGPLKRKGIAASREISTLQPKLADAEKRIKARDQLKARVPHAEAFLVQVESMIPEGAPIAWFPTMINNHFKARGGERVSTRMLNEVADPAVEGYQRISWTIEIPKTDAIEFASVLSDFENKQPLVDCQSIIIEFTKEDPANQRVTMSLANSVKK
jgi:hypothetical protein